jgi:hypothetical protein
VLFFSVVLSARWKWRRKEDGPTRRGVQPRKNRVEIKWMEHDGDGNEIIRSHERMDASARRNQIWMNEGR